MGIVISLLLGRVFLLSGLIISMVCCVTGHVFCCVDKGDIGI